MSPSATFSEPTPTPSPLALSVDELKGVISGTLNGDPIEQSDILVSVVEDSPGKLDWRVSFATGETEKTYLPMLPALVQPAGWLIARKVPDSLVQNGLVATGGQPFNATVILSFPVEGVQLKMEIFSKGLSIQGEKNVIDYSIEISGSHPPDFDGLNVFPVTFQLDQPSHGTIRAEGVLSGGIELDLYFSYTPTGSSRLVPTAFFTVSTPGHSVDEDALSFVTTSELFAHWQDIFRK